MSNANLAIHSGSICSSEPKIEFRWYDGVEPTVRVSSMDALAPSEISTQLEQPQHPDVQENRNCVIRTRIKSNTSDHITSLFFSYALPSSSFLLAQLQRLFLAPNTLVIPSAPVDTLPPK
jgi:hypothetical protein